MKKGIIISDLHCGSRTGLTPPKWQSAGIGYLKDIKKLQQQCWNWFNTKTSLLPELDFVIASGDLVDGPGEKSGGSEQLMTDVNIQADMASTILNGIMSEKTKLYITYGTPYHTGQVSDTESIIAKTCNAEKIAGHLFLDIEGVIFDIKHKTGSSGIPHGRATAIKKAQLWNKLWSLAKEQPNADVIIRSHVHYHSAAYDPDLGWAMTTPCLQAFGTKYGARQCEGRVHFGFLYVECDKGEFSYKPIIAKIKAHQTKAVKL